MALGTESAVSSVELESFAKAIPSLIPRSKTLYSLAKERFTNVPVSFQTATGSGSGLNTRPSFRVPFRAQGGAFVSQGTGNADALGRGNASQWVDFVLSPVWHYAVTEITHLAQLATKGANRSKISLRAEELKNSLDSTMAGIEGVMYGDSSGAITQIPSTATISLSGGSGNQVAYIQGVRAMAFTDNQVVQIFAAEGDAALGSATISVNDPASSTLFFSTVLPADTAAGCYIMIAGSSGVYGEGVFGTTSWINSSSSGVQAGVDRASYPNRITSPSINLDGGTISASLSGRIEALLGRAMGGDNKTKDSGIYLFGEDQAYAVATTNYYNKQITQNSDKSPNNEVPDTSRKYFQGTYGGRDVHVSYVQPLGRVDLILTDDWTIGELVPLQLYDYSGAGDNFVPVPDPDGHGWLTSNQFSYEIGFNMACGAPKHQLFVYDAAPVVI